MTTQKCTKCKNELPATLEYFSPEKRKANGLNSWCRSCRNNKVKVHHKTENGQQQVLNANRKYQKTEKFKVARKRSEDKKKDLSPKQEA